MTNNTGITIVTGEHPGSVWRPPPGCSLAAVQCSYWIIRNPTSKVRGLLSRSTRQAQPSRHLTSPMKRRCCKCSHPTSRPVPPSQAWSTAPASALTFPSLRRRRKPLRDMLEVNLVGTFAISREVAKRMVGTGGGSIVHISSVSGLIGNKGRSAYGATKAALVNLTQVMSNELARHHIRVNCVCPGPIETPLGRCSAW